MCLTYRHDFGLLPDYQQKGIWLTMAQIFDNDILPNMKYKTEADFGYEAQVKEFFVNQNLHSE